MEQKPIVGIGASAGGIEALTQFFDVMPADSGLTFIIVLHLDPAQHSYLAQILSQHTAMPVKEVTESTPLAPNTLFVVVPGCDLTVSGSMIRATAPAASRRHRHPVDLLFRSLADHYRQRAIGVILSGTGSNGTQGARDIRDAGGVVLVQDPASARFSEMPHSALSADVADQVLTPARMPPVLLNYSRQAYSAAEDDVPPRQSDAFKDILGFLANSAGVSFGDYRPGTLLRRINRRMSLRGLDTTEAYRDVVQAEVPEAQALIRDLLINVTSFYRDPEAWLFLEREVIARTVEAHPQDGVLRVWVPACSTGEEAYSIAMLLIETIGLRADPPRLSLFATDLLEDNLRVARQGIYPAASVETLSPARIRRFFDHLDTGHYQVKSDLREMITFARHDLLRNPPFARLDLLSCRNMLIYIEPGAQAQALSVFHFALKPDGILFLGSAESTTRMSDLFEPISKRWRIYRRVGPSRSDPAPLGRIGRTELGSNPVADPMPSSGRLIEALRRALLDRYAPTAVVVNASRRIIYFHGDVQPYLRPPSGEPTLDVVAMVHNGLRMRLRSGLDAIKGGSPRIDSRITLRDGDSVSQIDVSLIALPVVANASGLVLITFVAVASPDHLPAIEPAPAFPDLEAELHVTRTELQETIRELEIANDELRRAHADVVLMNEELQSTNEELETSKEELQSFNEELHSVNAQLQYKVNEVEEISNNLNNLLSGTEIATIFLDADLRIRWSSPAVSNLFDLVANDIGRPLQHFSRKFSDENLMRDAEAVLARLSPVDMEVRNDKGSWFLRRILPYRTRDQRIEGLVITFFDITAQKMSAAGDNLRHLNEELERRVSERTEALEHANHELVRRRLEQRRVEEEMQFLAHHDRLTGLPNRLRLGKLLEPLLADASRSMGRVALLCLDLDGFKLVNDTLGHFAGDRLLQLVTARLSALLNTGDILARVGGDEFVAVRAHVDSAEDAIALARRIVTGLTEPVTIDGQNVRVGTSVGIALAPDDGVDAERLMQNADIALYRVKAEGGGTWKRFTVDMFLEQNRRHRIEIDLRQAVENKEFVLHYQPIVSLDERRITACEALLRWQHPVHGMLAPDAFIAIAEKAGAIIQIENWVLQTACATAKTWPDTVAIAVNLSAAHLRHGTVVSDIATILAQTGLEPARLQIEVTESVMLENIFDVRRTLAALHALGIVLVMDDFGTGYSSLTQLHAFPYRRLKLDRSFTRTLADEGGAITIVRAVLVLGRELGMRVTVEGVETAEQLEILTRLECPDVQGYLLGYPVGAEEIGSRLARGLKVDVPDRPAAE